LLNRENQLSKSRVEKYTYYIGNNGNEVRHGLYHYLVRAAEGYLYYPGGLSIDECGAYVHGKKHGMWLEEMPTFCRTLTLYEYGDTIKIESYTWNWKRVASCTFKDGKIYNGTYWLLCIGVNGIKTSVIQKFNEFQMVEEVDYTPHPPIYPPHPSKSNNAE
jgi:hypothetical protein